MQSEESSKKLLIFEISPPPMQAIRMATSPALKSELFLINTSILMFT